MFRAAIFSLLMILPFSIFALEKTAKIPDDVLQLAKNSNAFALNVYHQMPSNENIGFSPFSISSAFAMVYSGAGGETKKEIMQVMQYPSSVKSLDQGWSWLNQFLTFFPSNSSEELRVKIANSLWVQTNFPVLPAFRDTMSKYFDGTFRFVDFKTQTDTARATINAWVKQNTFGKITDILTDQSIDKSTRMVLVSALYLKAKWKHPFDAHATSQQPFFLPEGNTQTALTLSQINYYPYLNTPEASLLEMPYILSRPGGPEFSMLIVLPQQADGLAELEKQLSVAKLEQWIHELKETRIILTIPKFKILQSHDLKDLLINMGMQLSFSDQADFSGISGVRGLNLGNVQHKVYISSDESGSEAAAATSIGINVTAVRDQPPAAVFKADHPFLYFIFEKKTGTILFMGRLANPNQN